MSNLPPGRVAVLLSPKAIAFAIHNARVNEQQLTAKVMQMAAAMQAGTLDDDPAMRDLLLKLDELKTSFRDLLKELEEAM